MLDVWDTSERNKTEGCLFRNHYCVHDILWYSKVNEVDWWEQLMMDSFFGGVDDDDTMMELI